ncbi:WG repeat-containing protein [Mucilaginibacter pedocola]|uniref:Uncharacterized protein n=1 Tax=Mucilaginibacter pedocola TaxID=1792845 RepID=A0A1S9PKI9_9SPHI|nr:WG repeat-containing protein [Mucilaginibacter pedocola]OOQ61464.1 hypothetical protein BC343_21110 [Mucilaginibacter pedocola]
MKTKPVLIVAAALAVVVCGFLFNACKTVNQPEKGELMAFLKTFNSMLEGGQTEVAQSFFDNGDNDKANKILVNVLSGKTGLSGKKKPLFKVSLDVDNAGIDITQPGSAEARITVSFEHPKVERSLSSISFTIHKTVDKQFKISGAKTDDFRADYARYQNKVINATIPETELYKPITLAAFKTAEQLKSRYDSVLWFQHIDNKTWFYVIKGTIEDTYYYEDRLQPSEDRKKSDFKMGLVNPQMEEVIPIEYDLVHNIGGMIDSLIEVEKGGKKGLYNMQGKLVVPVDYDQVLPLTDGENLAVLKKGSTYAYLKNDLTMGEDMVDFKIGDILSKIKYLSGSAKLSEKSSKTIMEYNSRNTPNSLVISPSYMVELSLLPKFMEFPNPLRTGMNEEDGGNGSGYIAVEHTGDENKEENWFQSAFYSVVNDYLGGRGGLYQDKQIVIVDKRQNKLLGFGSGVYMGDEEGGGPLSGECKENTLRAINDSLFEFKTTSSFYMPMYDSTKNLMEGPYYHYLQVKNGNIKALRTDRFFPTQFLKLDDSYLQGCYVLGDNMWDEKEKKTVVNHVTPDMLQYMKNEIYASYHYKFKNPRWKEIFEYRFYNNNDTTRHDNVDDSLTVIDKYNIEWINKKLKITKPATVALR